MNKLYLSFMLLVLFTSCQKQWTCTTHISYGGGNFLIVEETFWGTRKDKEAKEQAGTGANSRTVCK